jgi:hypothetical protein
MSQQDSHKQPQPQPQQQQKLEKYAILQLFLALQGWIVLPPIIFITCIRDSINTITTKNILRPQQAFIKYLGEFTPSYILHTRAFGTYLLGGLFTLQKRL